jgi:FKBP-type peptidyl-prolyl cis-trans isomerase FkpA
MRLLFPVLMVAALAASACGGSDDSPTGPSSSLPRGEYSQTDLVVGTGTQATAGSSIRVNYSLWIYNPAGADGKGQLVPQPPGPLDTRLVSGAIIQGWIQGVPGMRVGGRRRLVLPPELAYGATGAGNGVIPPNATLVFEIELLSVS